MLSLVSPRLARTHELATKTVPQIVRRLTVRHPSVPLSSVRFSTEQIREAAELAILDRRALHGMVLSRLDEPTGAILSELLAGAGRNLERAWRSDQISSTERAIGIAALIVESRWLAQRLPLRLSPNPGHVLVVQTPVSVPALEPSLFAIYANALGWSVSHAVGPRGVVEALNESPVDLVLLSVTRISDLRHALACVRDGRRARYGMSAHTFAVTSPLFGSIARRAGRIVQGLFFDVRELVPVIQDLETEHPLH